MRRSHAAQVRELRMVRSANTDTDQRQVAGDLSTGALPLRAAGRIAASRCRTSHHHQLPDTG